MQPTVEIVPGNYKLPQSAIEMIANELGVTPEEVKAKEQCSGSEPTNSTDEDGGRISKRQKTDTKPDPYGLLLRFVPPTAANVAHNALWFTVYNSVQMFGTLHADVPHLFLVDPVQKSMSKAIQQIQNIVTGARAHNGNVWAAMQPAHAPLAPLPCPVGSVRMVVFEAADKGMLDVTNYPL